MKFDKLLTGFKAIRIWRAYLSRGLTTPGKYSPKANLLMWWLNWITSWQVSVLKYEKKSSCEKITKYYIMLFLKFHISYKMSSRNCNSFFAKGIQNNRSCLTLKESFWKASRSCTCTPDCWKLFPGAKWKFPATLFTSKKPYTLHPSPSSSLILCKNPSLLHYVTHHMSNRGWIKFKIWLWQKNYLNKREWEINKTT